MQTINAVSTLMQSDSHKSLQEAPAKGARKSSQSPDPPGRQSAHSSKPKESSGGPKKKMSSLIQS